MKYEHLKGTKPVKTIDPYELLGTSTGVKLRLKQPLVILIGESGTGKTYLKDLICKTYDYGDVIGYTNRSPRKNEREGVDYYFRTSEEINDLKGVLDYVNYDNKLHATTIESVIEAQDKGKRPAVAVMTAKGYLRLQEVFDGSLIPLVVRASHKTRETAIMERDGNTQRLPEMDGDICNPLLQYSYTIRCTDDKGNWLSDEALLSCIKPVISTIQYKEIFGV